ncbi:STE like transcription factor-domain-containing protein [Choanephora cucurbitarum]|nr:STE like transcription factor-domain-containing protein [Choanephora cucurbitarum]
MQDESFNNEDITHLPAALRLEPPTNENTEERLQQIDELKYFLGTATNDWDPSRQVHSFPLPTGESLSCVFWNDLFHVTGTDIVRCLLYRFHLFGRPVTNLKKFEEGIFSDLRNLKPGMDASLEEPKSEFLEMLYKNNCIRTQKKQKVFFWFSVPHDRLFLDALERDLKREKMGLEPTSLAIAEPAMSLSLDTTQELFDQLRKSMSLSAVAVAHALDENLNFHNSTISTSPSSSTTSLTATADDISVATSHDWSHLKSTEPQEPIHSPQPDSPKPYLPQDDKQQKIFGAFSLFEGSPTYKQRQRRRTFSSYSPVAVLSPENTPINSKGHLDMTAINPHHLFQVLRKQQQSDMHDSTEKVYTCPLPQCARLFKRLEHLKRHFRTHTLERPYSCNMCGKNFSRTDNLAQHKKTHNRTRSTVSRSSSMRQKDKPSSPISQERLVEQFADLSSQDYHFQTNGFYSSPIQSIHEDLVQLNDGNLPEMMYDYDAGFSRPSLPTSSSSSSLSDLVWQSSQSICSASTTASYPTTSPSTSSHFDFYGNPHVVSPSIAFQPYDKENYRLSWHSLDESLSGASSPTFQQFDPMQPIYGWHT